jgi:antitoxin VapB
MIESGCIRRCHRGRRVGVRVLNGKSTEVVERAIDRLAGETQGAADPGRMAALLAQLDRVPDRTDAFDPSDWDTLGLPK